MAALGGAAVIAADFNAKWDVFPIAHYVISGVVKPCEHASALEVATRREYNDDGIAIEGRHIDYVLVTIDLQWGKRRQFEEPG